MAREAKYFVVQLYNSEDSIWGIGIGLNTIFINSLNVKNDVITFCDIYVGCTYPILETWNAR